MVSELLEATASCQGGTNTENRFFVSILMHQAAAPAIKAEDGERMEKQ